MSTIKTSVIEMVKAIKKGEISSEELAKSYIQQIKKKEKDIEAFQFFDEEHILDLRLNILDEHVDYFVSFV